MFSCKGQYFENLVLNPVEASLLTWSVLPLGPSILFDVQQSQILGDAFLL